MIPLRLCSLTLMLLIAAIASARAGAPAKPNVIIINIDDMGWGDFESYGSQFSNTPNIDQLASEGTRFDQFYAGAAICSPSRVAMFTGQYSARSNINSFLSSSGENLAKDSVDHLDLAAPSMAQTFKAGGYATGHFGKWHLGGGRDVGYATNPTPSTNTTAPKIVEYGYDQAWTQFEGLGNRIINVVDYGGDKNGVATRPSAYLNGLNVQSDNLGDDGGQDQIVYLEREFNATFMIDRAIEFIDNTKTADPTQPVFMNVWLDEVHTPHDPPPAIVAKYNNDPKYAGLPQRQRDYLAVLEATDTQIGRLVDYIDSQGLGDETLVLVTADNGADPDNVALLDSSGPFRGNKGEVFEGGIREPLIARWSGNVAAGRVDTQTVMGMADLFPTLTTIASINNPTGVTFDGEDLSEALLGNQTQTRTKPLFWNTNRGVEDRHDSPDASAAGSGGQEVLALRSDDWKLIVNANGTAPELYDLSVDQGETNNVALQKAAVTNQLAQEALAIRYSTPARILPDTVTPIVRLVAGDIGGGDGAAVSSWNDRAGGDSFDGAVDQGVAASQPILRTDVLNGRAVVEFDGVNDVLGSSTNNSLPNSGEGITVFAVASSDSSGSPAQRLAQLGDNAGVAGQSVGFDMSNTSTSTGNGGAGFRFNAGAALYDTPIAGNSDFHIVAWQIDDGQAYADAKLFVDGTLPANTFTGTANNANSVNFSGNDLELLLGNGRNGALLGDNYGGQLAEFLVFNSQLTLGEINLVANYLSTEYGLPFAYNTTNVNLFAIEGLTWVGGTANFDSQWNRGDGSLNPASSNSNPFGNGGTEDLYLASGGTAIYNSSTNTAAGTQVNTMRIGTSRAGQVVAGTSGAGTLIAENAVSLTIGSGNAPVGAAETGDLTIGEGGQTGTLHWNSTGTLKVEGQLRVGQGGIGIVNQNAGVVTAGDVAGSLKFAAIGVGSSSAGTYNLNAGSLRPGGGLGGSALERHLRIGFDGGVGTLNVGDGSGSAGSARLESKDDLFVGYDGGVGTLLIASDGVIDLNGNQAPVSIGLNAGSVGQAVQLGGTFTSDSDFSIGMGFGAVGSYLLSGGSLETAGDGLGEFRIGSTGGTGTMRIEGNGSFRHRSALFIGHQGGTGATGRLEIVGSQASVQVAKFDNAPGTTGAGNGVDETIRWEADAGGITTIVVDATSGGANFVQIQDVLEVGGNDGMALELDLAAISTSTTLTLIDNRSNEAVIGRFENGTSGELFSQGDTIAGTGFHGLVTLSYQGSSGIGSPNNDVTLTLVAAEGLAGDYNGDNIVNLADYTVWRDTLGSTTNLAANGEMNGASAGVIDYADYVVWQNNFNAALAANAANSLTIPEPPASVMLAIIVIVFVSSRVVSL